MAPTDIIVSFDIESLFTNVPIEFMPELLTTHFTPYIINLFLHLKSILFHQIKFVAQTDCRHSYLQGIYGDPKKPPQFE